MVPFATEYYTESSVATMRRLSSAWLSSHWWLLAVPALAAAVAAAYDWRWAIVFFALVLLVYPMVLFFVIFTKALKQPYPSFLVPHRICFGESALVIEFKKDEDFKDNKDLKDSEDFKDLKDSKDFKNFKDFKDDYHVPETIEIAYTNIKKVEDEGKNLVITIKDPAFTLWIPTSVFFTPDDVRSALTIL